MPRVKRKKTASERKISPLAQRNLKKYERNRLSSVVRRKPKKYI